MYRTIDTSFWDDPRIRALEPAAKLLFLHLVTNRHAHCSGIYCLRLEYAALETGLSLRQVEACLAALTASGLVRYEAERGVIWVVRMLRHQGRGAKLMQAAAAQLRALHRSPLVAEFLEAYPGVRACREESQWAEILHPEAGATARMPSGWGIDGASGPPPGTADTPSILPDPDPDPDPVPAPVSGDGESEGKGQLTQDGVAKALKLRLGSSLNPCRDQVRTLVSSGWKLAALAAAVQEHGEPGLAPWDWTKRVGGLRSQAPHRRVPNAGELLRLGASLERASPGDPLALPGASS